MQRSVLLFALVSSVGCVDGMEALPEDVDTSALTSYDLREDVDFDAVSVNTRGDVALGGACIDAAGATPPSGQPWWIQQFRCNGGLNQNVRLERSRWASYAWEIRSASDDDYCLDVPSWNYASGQRLHFYRCNGGSNQAWEITGAGSARFQIRPLYASTLCLDVADAIPDAQAAINLYRCEYGKPNQTWYLREVVKRDSFSASIGVRFYPTIGESVHLAPGEVKSFVTGGGRVWMQHASGSSRYVCDTGNYDTNRVVVDFRSSTLKVSCLHQ